MHRLAVAPIALAGCLSNPTVEVDSTTVDVPHGASHDVLVSVDGAPLDVEAVMWSVEDPDIASVVVAHDGRHLQIGGNAEGETIVHVYSYGQDVAIPTRVGPPAILEIWTVPTTIYGTLGEHLRVEARGLDTLARVQDLTFASRWTVRDPRVALVEPAGMTLHAMSEGRTSLHVTNGALGAVVPVLIDKLK